MQYPKVVHLHQPFSKSLPIYPQSNCNCYLIRYRLQRAIASLSSFDPELADHISTLELQ